VAFPALCRRQLPRHGLDQALGPGKIMRAGLAGNIPRQETVVIHVLAIITTKPNQRDAVLEAFRANLPAVHAEAGGRPSSSEILSVGTGRERKFRGPAGIPGRRHDGR
jgi:hypothetical protein